MFTISDYDVSKNMTIAGAVEKGERKESSVSTKATKMKAKKGKHYTCCSEVLSDTFILSSSFTN